MLKRDQLNRILSLVEAIAKIETKEKRLEVKKCNFYNRGFCSKGLACTFSHPQELCERFESVGVCEVSRCRKRHLYSCRYLNSRSGCGRGESCHFSHRLVSTFQDEKNENTVKSQEVTLNEEKNCEELRKSKLGGRKFGWSPRGMGSFKDKPVCENIPGNNPADDQNVPESDVQVVEEEKDMYEELIEAMNEGNEELTDQMMDRILNTFEAVEGEKRKNLKGKKVEAKKTKRKVVGSVMKGKGRGRGK